MNELWNPALLYSFHQALRAVGLPLEPEERSRVLERMRAALAEALVEEMNRRARSNCA